MKKLAVFVTLLLSAISLAAIAYAYAPNDKVTGGPGNGWSASDSSAVRLDNIPAQAPKSQKMKETTPYSSGPGPGWACADSAPARLDSVGKGQSGEQKASPHNFS